MTELVELPLGVKKYQEEASLTSATETRQDERRKLVPLRARLRDCHQLALAGYLLVSGDSQFRDKGASGRILGSFLIVMMAR